MPRRRAAIGMLRHRAVIGVVAATFALTGCAASFGSETGQVYDQAAGVNHRSGDVYMLDAVVIVDGQGHGTLSGTLTSQAGTDDALTDVKIVSKTSQAASVTLQGGEVNVPAGGAVKLLDGNLVRFDAPSLEAGYFVTLQFSFRNAGGFTLNVPILPNSSDFSTVSVPTNASS
jgi:hypothetical protein